MLSWVMDEVLPRAMHPADLENGGHGLLAHRNAGPASLHSLCLHPQTEVLIRTPTPSYTEFLRWAGFQVSRLRVMSQPYANKWVSLLRHC